jgi:hypothetical protein
MELAAWCCGHFSVDAGCAGGAHNGGSDAHHDSEGRPVSGCSKDWMFRSVEIPKVRAHLFARLCLASSEHAAKAQAMLGRSPKIDDELLKYVDDLRRTAKGKACRFLACDAETGGKTGEGIAWLRGAKKELGFTALASDEEKKSSGFSKLKKEWQEKREDRKIEKGVDWGTDAGKFEEGRIIDMLLKKWEKMNDTVSLLFIEL